MTPNASSSVCNEAGVQHVIIGGWAVNAHGHRRFTGDVDICPDPRFENLARLAVLLRDLNAQQLGLEHFDPAELPGNPTDPESLAEGGNFRPETELGILDIMQWISGEDRELSYDEVAREAVHDGGIRNPRDGLFAGCADGDEARRRRTEGSRRPRGAGSARYLSRRTGRSARGSRRRRLLVHQARTRRPDEGGRLRLRPEQHPHQRSGPPTSSPGWPPTPPRS